MSCGLVVRKLASLSFFGQCTSYEGSISVRSTTDASQPISRGGWVGCIYLIYALITQKPSHMTTLYKYSERNIIPKYPSFWSLSRMYECICETWQGLSKMYMLFTRYTTQWKFCLFSLFLWKQMSKQSTIIGEAIIWL